MSEGWRQHVLLISTAVAVLFFRLGEARLWDRDEPRNARCAVEMIERHDWVVPYFNSELRTHKPVLLYWLIMSAYAVFGVTEFAARFWSAALGVGTVLCTYYLGRRLFHRDAGFWAALLLTPALMFNVASRAATPDGLLIFLTTATLLAFVWFSFPADSSSKTLPAFPKLWWQGAIIYALMGLAVLAKGPVGIVVPGAVMFLSLWFVRVVSRFRCADQNGSHSGTDWLHSLIAVLLEMRPLLAILTLIMVAGPWYLWVGLRTEGEFLIGFLWDHNVRRATESMEGHHGSPIFFYPAVLCVGFFPASIFFLPTLLNVWQNLNKPSQYQASLFFCLAWLMVIVGIFSVASTKLPSYVTPCYPALALLVGFTLAAWMKSEAANPLRISPAWFRVSLVTLIAVGGAVVPGLYWVARQHLPGAEWLASLGLILLLGGVASLVVEWFMGNVRGAVGVLAVSGLLFTSCLFGFGTVEADAHQQSHILFRTILERSQHPQVASWKCLESSWVYYLREPITELPKATGTSPTAVAPQDEAQLAAFLSRGDDCFAIVKANDWPTLQPQMPKNIGPLAEISLFLKEDRLILLGRTPESNVAHGGSQVETLQRK